MARPKESKNKPKEPSIGHNSHVTEFDRHKLHRFIDRIEAVETDKAQIAADIKDIYAEAKENGFDVAAIRQIIKIRKQDTLKIEARQAVIDAYMHALGMLADTPLGQAAIARDLGDVASSADTSERPFA
jgi:uncharacterized protein (UPF0335 family)